MEKIVALMMRSMVELSRYCRFDTWQPGNKLKLLLIGYNGRRNTGADLRVVAMVDQFCHILGRENIEIGVLTLDVSNIEDYFYPPVKLEAFDPMFIFPLLKVSCAYHIGVLSEGSCLTSTFANALSLLFVGFAGAMKRQGKPCIAYGSEAGKMDAMVYQSAQEMCDETHFIARSQASLDIIRGMQLEGSLGTDTAWIIPSKSKDWLHKNLGERVGWDGERPLVGLAVINPFWWPVRANLVKYLLGKWKKSSHYQYAGWYFFSCSEERRWRFDQYLSSIAQVADMLVARHHAQVIILGMETVDHQACHKLQSMLKDPAPVFGASDYDAYQLTTLLRSLTMLITSRYHAKVLSMPAGVPSIAISMDERLHNLFAESGHLDDYYLRADDVHLEENLHHAVGKLWANRDDVSAEILAMMPYYLRTLAGMGATFRKFIEEHFPSFPLPPEPPNWLGYLPPLASELRELID